MDLSDGSCLDFDVSNISLPSNIATSTPRKSRSTKKAIFAVPKPSNKEPRGPIIGTCHKCSKSYRSKKFFENHLKAHKLQEAAFKYPNKKVLCNNKDLIWDEVMNRMKKTPVTPMWGEACSDLLNDMISRKGDYEACFDLSFNKLVDKVSSDKFCLPSVLHQKVQGGGEDVLCDLDLRNQILFLFQSVNPSIHRDAINSFVVEFVFKTGDVLIHFITKCLVESSQHLSPQLSVSVKERQLINYISGSIIRSFLKKCLKCKENLVLQKIFVAIKSCVLEGEVVASAADTDKYWTSFCNRGALNFVGESFLTFMIAVVQILCAVEKPDGSLIHEEVQAALTRSNALTIWDNMMKTTLDPITSVKFMRGVVRSFTNSYGRGVYLKHINRNMKRPQASISLRKRLGAICM